MFLKLFFAIWFFYEHVQIISDILDYYLKLIRIAFNLALNFIENEFLK